jgi:hypothetical protein
MVPSKAVFTVLFPAVVFLLAGCGAVLINEGSKEEPLSDGLKNPEVQKAQVKVSPAQAIISNFEDGTNKMNPLLYGSKAGVWTATNSGGVINTPLVVPGGANGTAMALHVSGTLVNKGDNTYPSVLLAGKFKPRAYYDASPFHGIRFYYKCPADDLAPGRRFNIPIAATVPTSSGGICTDSCYNHFGVDLTTANDWVKKQLSFNDLQRQSGWGSAVTPPDFTDHLREIVDIEWMEGSGNTAGTYAIDYWVDEVEFF